MASKEAQAAEAQADLKKKGSAYRFWIRTDTEAKITFLDGGLQADGTLDSVVYHEHNVQIGGRYGNTFVCTKEFEACPLCEQGDNSAFVAAFTIIDHRSYKDKEGKEYKNQVRLFVCKLDTYKLLQKIATKRGGLDGCSFDVSRTGDKSANVGNMFDFISKKSAAAYMKKYDASVIDYIEAIPYLNGEELRKLGFGNDNTDAYDMPDEDDEDLASGVDEDDEL